MKTSLLPSSAILSVMLVLVAIAYGTASPSPLPTISAVPTSSQGPVPNPSTSPSPTPTLGDYSSTNYNYLSSIILLVVGLLLITYGILIFTSEYWQYHLHLSGSDKALGNKNIWELIPLTHHSIAGISSVFLGIGCAFFVICCYVFAQHSFLIIVIFIGVENVLMAVLVYSVYRIFYGHKNPIEYSVFSSIFILTLGAVCFLPATITLVQTQAIASISPNDMLGIMLGIVIVATSGLITSILQQKDFVLRVSKELGGKLDGVKGFTEFYEQFREECGHKLLRELINLLRRRETESKQIRLALHDRINEAINTWESGLQDGWTDPYGYKEEGKRVNSLKNIVRRAHSYVRAVTYDAGTYITDFFEANNSSQAYIDANNEQSMKRVDIERIFILEDDLFSVQQSVGGILLSKRKVVQRLLRYHQQYSMGYFVVRKIEFNKHFVNEPWGKEMRSFFVCDGCISSESYLLDNNVTQKQTGYIHYAFRYSDKIEQLRSRFDVIKAVCMSSDHVDVKKLRDDEL